MTAILAHTASTNIRRLTCFIKDLEKDPCDYYKAKPSEDITIWYVKICNLSDEYVGGEYILKIHFTEKYPFEPPSYYMLTPSGRFQINQKICLSNSGYHADTWSPLWGINQIIMGIISFFYERESHGISHISNSSVAERAKYASDSIKYNHENLKSICDLF
jgi:ubiquitin-protein ligase